MFLPTLLKIRFAGCRRCRKTIAIEIYPNGEIELCPAPLPGETFGCEHVQRIEKLCSDLLQLSFLGSEPDPSEFNEIDFGGKENTLLDYINYLRANMVCIASRILSPVTGEVSRNTLREWAWLLGGTSSLTIDSVSHCSLFTKLSIAFHCDHRFEARERIVFLEGLLNNNEVVKGVRIRLCEQLGSINSLDCLVPLAHFSCRYGVGPTARSQCARLLHYFQERREADFHQILAKIVVALREVNPREFRAMFHEDVSGMISALRAIVSVRNQEYSGKQKFCAVILLTRWIGSSANQIVLELYRQCDSENREMLIEHLLFELVDLELTTERNAQVVLEQILGCLSDREPERTLEIVKLLVSVGFRKLLETSVPKLTACGIDLESLVEPDDQFPETAFPRLWALLTPSEMLPPPVQRKSLVL